MAKVYDYANPSIFEIIKYFLLNPTQIIELQIPDFLCAFSIFKKDKNILEFY